jgi:hypothetical protein
VTQFADVYEQLTAHMKKLADLQRQLDEIVRPAVDESRARTTRHAAAESRDTSSTKAKP